MKCPLVQITATTIASLAWFGLITGQAVESKVTWSPDLKLRSRANIPSAMLTPLSDIPNGIHYTNGTADRTIRTCRDYFSSVRAGFHAKNNLTEQLTSSFVFRCYILRDLQTARPAMSGSPYYWTARSLSQLPPILVVGSKDVQEVAEKVEREGGSWQQYSPKLKITSINSDQLIAEDDDNYYTLIIIARGDFNGDGIEDFALVGVAKGKQTSWASSQYFVFSRLSNGNIIRLTSNEFPYQMKTQIAN